MRVLVTGAGGFIGGYVCLELINRGHEPVSFDHPNDVRDRAALEAAISRVDAVINLAGILGTAETIGEEFKVAEVNILGALNVFDLAVGKPVVQIATGHEGQPNPYAITKRCTTELALSRARWTGQKITVVRAFHAYGAGQKMCAPHGSSKVRKIIPSFVARAITGMPIEIHGDGQQVIDLVHVEDVARTLVDALGGPYGEVVDAGTGEGTRVIDAAFTVAALSNSKSQIIHGPMRQGEPDGSVVVAEDPKCSNLWPYKLQEAIAWYRDKLRAAA
jgi:UDP-glucose 4-epimerase